MAASRKRETWTSFRSTPKKVTHSTLKLSRAGSVRRSTPLCACSTARDARWEKATTCRIALEALPIRSSRIGKHPPTDSTPWRFGTCCSRGGPEYVYFLKIARAEPEFELDLDTDKTEIVPGASAVIFVNSLRKNGFDGEITLSIANLPAGVTAQCGRIPRGHRDGCIILTAAPHAQPGISNVVITGVGQHKESSGSFVRLTAVARPWQETYFPGGGRGHWPVEMHSVAVAARGDLLGVRLDKQQIVLKPGGTVRVDVAIERSPGFTDNVTLNPQFDHLGRVFGQTLPRGVEIDRIHSKTLLTGKESRGFLVFRAAPNVERLDKALVSVMANVSINFVMKSTYSSSPLIVTTQSK